MPKRSKSNTDGAVFTYHERKRMDHGSAHLRLPGTAMKAWDRCALSLSEPVDPVVTPHGVLYDREVILRELLRQRGEVRESAALAQAERLKEEESKQKELKEAEKEAVARFESFQDDIRATSPGKEEQTKQPGDALPESSNFWLPSSSSQLSQKRKWQGEAKKPSLKTRCPIAKKNLRSKDLVPLKPTLSAVGTVGALQGDDAKTLDRKPGKYVCPLCRTLLTNAAKPVALRTGTVLCMRCVNEFVKTEKKDPCTSETIDVKNDIIPIYNVGTAFAASAANDPASRNASMYRPSAR